MGKETQVITVLLADTEKHPCYGDMQSQYADEKFREWRGKPIQIINAPLTREQFEEYCTKNWQTVRPCGGDMFWPVHPNSVEKIHGKTAERWVCRHEIQIGD